MDTPHKADSPLRIESTPGVCGGDPCIAQTRIPIWLLESLRHQGLSDSELLASYPTLRDEDLKIAWDYISFHSAEIERQIREQDEV